MNKYPSGNLVESPRREPLARHLWWAVGDHLKAVQNYPSMVRWKARQLEKRISGVEVVLHRGRSPTIFRFLGPKR